MMNGRLVTSTIVETLGREGAVKVDALYKTVRKLHSDVEKGAFEETLMALEVQGLIRVYNMTRGQRRVELVRG
jgi:DNA-binding PadR family transcriptional regulator